MVKKKYKAILLDLFGTVVLFNKRKLPRTHVNGLEYSSTAEKLYEILETHHPQISLEVFCQTLFKIRREIKKTKDQGFREVHSLERFRRLTHRLSLPLGNGAEQMAERFNKEHMNWIKNCVEFPSDHLPILKSMSETFPLALVSNFDHAPTGYQILEQYDLVPFFRTILFSDELGWCKPHPILFTTALERLGVTPEEALFVGDTPELDTLGPKNIGMDVAWIENTEHPLPSHYPEPDYYLRKFSDLTLILTPGDPF